MTEKPMRAPLETAIRLAEMIGDPMEYDHGPIEVLPPDYVPTNHHQTFTAEQLAPILSSLRAIMDDDYQGPLEDHVLWMRDEAWDALSHAHALRLVDEDFRTIRQAP